MDEVSKAVITSAVNPDEIKMEVLHTFDTIDGELNISMCDSTNSEATKPTDIKTEMGSEFGQTAKSVDGASDNLSNGNIDLKFENNDNNTSLAKEICKVAAIDQNYNLTGAETMKDLMATAVNNDELNTGSEKPLNAKPKLVNSSGLELNNSMTSNRTGMNASSDVELILRISDDSGDSDTDEVDSDSCDEDINDTTDEKNGEVIQRGDSLPEGLQDSTLDDKPIDENLLDVSTENSITEESKFQDKSKKKSTQTSLLDFLAPRKWLEPSQRVKKENEGIPKTAQISLSRLIMNSCTNCDKGYVTFGVEMKKCHYCGKRMKFNCFICEKLYNARSGIFNHVVQFHRFSLSSLNKKIPAFIKSNCTKCKSTFGWDESVCLKCNLNLEFLCTVCNERCETRQKIQMHVVHNHTEEFTNSSSKKLDANHRKSSRRTSDNNNSLLQDEKQDRGDATLIDKNTTTSRNTDAKQPSSGKRRVRFQLNNKETERESEFEDISKSEANVETSYPTTRSSVKRRSIDVKTVASTETHNKNNNLKKKVSNKRRNTSEVISSGEDTTETPTDTKQQIAGTRRSGRIKVNNSEGNSVSETSGSASKNSSRRRSTQMQMPSSIKSEDDIPPTSQQISIRRRSSRISSDKNSINRQNESTSVDSITVVENSVTEPKTQITRKRRRSKLADNSETNNQQDISIVEVVVHPVPEKYVATQQISAKRRSTKNVSFNSETSSHLENRYSDITPALNRIDSKPSVAQGKRRSLRSSLNTSDTNAHSNSTSLGIANAPEMSVTRQQILNKRRKSQNSISIEFDSRSEVSMDESNSEISVSGVPDRSHCSYCQKTFVDQKGRKQHEAYCRKEPDIFCDSCSYVTKYASNFKKHKLSHGLLKGSEAAEAKTSTAVLGNTDSEALFTADATCTDILSRMEAHCPKCKEDMKMKPNDTNCSHCNSKLILSCTKCCTVFADFLAIFNHLYKECTKKKYHCAKCVFTTTSLDIMHVHVHNDHIHDSSMSRESEKSSEALFVFAAQQKAPVTLNDAKMNLKDGYKTRALSSVKLKEKVTDEASAENGSKMKKCPNCNVKVPSLMKHLTQCKAELRCPFCSYTAKLKRNMRTHMAKCHGTKSHTIRFQALFNDERTPSNRLDIEEMMRSYCGVCDELQVSVPYELKCAACKTPLEHRCTKCQARFAQRQQLRKHVWRHLKAANYPRCAGCSKEFQGIENLRMHEKVCAAVLINATV